MNPRFYKDVDSTINIHHMLLVIVKANLYGDNSFTTNGNFLVSNYGVKYNLLLTVNNIEILFKFKRGTEAHFRIAGRRSTFWREISDSPTPISAEYEYDARRCLPILRQNEFPTFTIREQTYTFRVCQRLTNIE